MDDESAATQRTKSLDGLILLVLRTSLDRPELMSNKVVRARVNQFNATRQNSYHKTEVNKLLHLMQQQGRISVGQQGQYNYWFLSQEQRAQQRAAATETVSEEREEFHVVNYMPLGSTEMKTVTRPVEPEKDFSVWLAELKRTGFILCIHRQCNAVQRRQLSYVDVSSQYLTTTTKAPVVEPVYFCLKLHHGDTESVSYYETLTDATNAVYRLSEETHSTVSDMHIQRVTYGNSNKTCQ
jgi:hypothetical protein